MKKILSFVVILTVMFFGISNVSAMTERLPGDIHFTRGVNNTCYYVSSSASPYTSQINTAATQWASMYNRIKNTPVLSSVGTHIDFYAYSTGTDPIDQLDSDTNAYTRFFDANGKELWWNGRTNYFYTEVVINKSNYIDSSTIAHEMGHCYGLYESKNQYSIMYTPKIGRLVSTPQSVDNDAINFLYPLS